MKLYIYYISGTILSMNVKIKMKTICHTTPFADTYSQTFAKKWQFKLVLTIYIIVCYLQGIVVINVFLYSFPFSMICIDLLTLILTLDIKQKSILF